MNADALVREYLGRLEAAAWPLPQPRRTELVGEVREHIAAALSTAPARDEATVRNVLERLGPPEEIIAAEAGSFGPTPASAVAEVQARQSPVGGVEIAALVLLVVGGWLIPYIGTLLALVFVWASRRWTQREKLIASAIVVVLPLLTSMLVVLTAGA